MQDGELRTYTQLLKFSTFEERFRYLALKGTVGEATFGYDRWQNQAFYTSRQWKSIRQYVINRDEAWDLAVPGYDIFNRLYIHHMNPMTVAQLAHGEEAVLDPEFLITTCHRTHNAIHYGDENLLAKPLVERRPGDTQLWSRE